MKKIIFFLSIVISSISSYSLDTNGVHYFPLNIGNCWTYSYYSSVPPGTHYNVKVTIIEDTIINNKRFFVFSQDFPILNSFFYYPSNLLYTDSSSGNLITYKQWSCISSFMIVDSLSSGFNDIFHQCPGSASGDERFCMSTGVKNFAGNNYLYKKFKDVDNTFDWISEYLYNIGYSYGYANNFYPNWYQTYTLLGCVINGVLYGDTNTVGIQKIGDLIPDNFSLSQNYPNPFNPVTRIKYDVSSNVKRKTSNVKIIVYDILGREIETLVNESQKPGSYEVTWDGSRFASGVYFYRLITDDFTETKKMVLIK